MQQAMQWLFLAPDWTVSTLKQGMAPVTGPLRGKKALTSTSLRFWRNAAFYFFAITQGLNYYNTKRDYGKGRLTFDNPEGKKLDVYMGHIKRPGKDYGRERYMRIGKQFREIPEWFTNPMNKFGSKTSPAFQELGRQVFRVDPGSGFPTKFHDPESLGESMLERGKSILKTPLPFSLRPYVEDRPGVWMLSIPTSKGMTKYGAVKQFKNILRIEDENARYQALRTVYVQALQNNINAEKMLDVAAKAVGREAQYDDRQVAKEIVQEAQQLKTQEEINDLYETYKKRGILTESVERQLMKEIEDLTSIREQQAIHGIKYK
jgi:hypothetical protein